MKLVRDSFRRCDQQLGFIDSLYKGFLIASPSAAEKFLHTDMDHHTVMLRTSLELLIDSHDNPNSLTQPKKVVHFHACKGGERETRLYDSWMEVLIATIREFDPHFDQQLESAWRNFMQPRLSFIGVDY